MSQQDSLCPECGLISWSGHRCAAILEGEEHMSGDHNMFQKATSYLSGNAFWRTPEEDTPPTGVKMLLLNPGGVCIVGTWADWAVAWAPLPKVPEHIKQLLLERNT